MTQDEKQKFFADAFIEFMDKLMAGGSMTRSEVASHLTITLGRFIHDFLPEEKRAAFVMACCNGLTNAAFDDDPPTESVH